MPVPAIGQDLTELDLPPGSLVDHHGRDLDLATLTKPGTLPRAWGHPGPPLVLLTGRGWFCPRDQAHLTHLAAGWDRLSLSGASFVYVATQSWREQAAFRAGLGAGWTFASDPDRILTNALGLLDETEGEQADVMRPTAVVCDHDLVVCAAWDGWWIDGRPTVDELLLALRDLRADRADGAYQGWTDERVTSVRVPQRIWANDLDPLGTIARADVEATVATWSRSAGIGTLTLDDGTTATAHFTAVPGEGDRGVPVGAKALVDVLDHPSGQTLVTNIRTT